MIFVLLLLFVVMNQMKTLRETNNKIYELETSILDSGYVSKQLLIEKNQLIEDNNKLTKIISDLETKLKNTLPYDGADNSPLRLTNQDSVRNPTWEELKAFILMDNTDQLPYVEGVRICGDFAELLHNNAEKQGIRSGMIAVFFEGKEVGHAFNVFYTVDKGYVYVDSSGVTKTTECSSDKIVYMEKGKYLGRIDIDKVTSLEYEFYVDLEHLWKENQKLTEDYNSELKLYNAEVVSHSYIEGSSELRDIEKWRTKLNNILEQIKSNSKKLPKCFETESMGVVKTINTSW